MPNMAESFKDCGLNPATPPSLRLVAVQALTALEGSAEAGQLLPRFLEASLPSAVRASALIEFARLGSPSSRLLVSFALNPAHPGELRFGVASALDRLD